MAGSPHRGTAPPGRGRRTAVNLVGLCSLVRGHDLSRWASLRVLPLVATAAARMSGSRSMDGGWSPHEHTQCFRKPPCNHFFRAKDRARKFSWNAFLQSRPLVKMTIARRQGVWPHQAGAPRQSFTSTSPRLLRALRPAARAIRAQAAPRPPGEHQADGRLPHAVDGEHEASGPSLEEEAARRR